MCEDNSVLFYMVSEWTIVAKYQYNSHEIYCITKHIDWSPDGLYLLISSVEEDGAHVGQIIEREKWKCVKSMKIHKNGVISARFHQKKFFFSKNPSYLCALGSLV